MRFLQLLLFGVGRPQRAPVRPRRTVEVPVTSDALLRQIWLGVRRQWFPERPEIDEYVITWSRRRQKRTLGTCFPTRKRVVIALELQDPEYHCWLEPLIYHEMCHAVLGRQADRNGRNIWHGPDFKALERRHPGSKSLDDWIRTGGWARVVRRARARSAAAHRRLRQTG